MAAELAEVERAAEAEVEREGEVTGGEEAGGEGG